MSRTVADVLVGTLEQVGVRQLFGLIGDSLNPLADAIRRSRIDWIGVRHEEGAALAAAGQAKFTGRLAVCAGTTGPGSNHLVPGLYEAARDHAPVLAISGDMARKLRGTDYIQTTEPDLLFRDVSLYTETVASAAQAPRVFHEAIAAAYAGPGVAHLTIPQDVMGATAEGDVSSVATLKPPPGLAASEHDVVEMAKKVDLASSVVIMCGAGCHGAADELRGLSDLLNAPLIHSLKGKDIMPYDDPHWMGGIGMIGTKASYDAVMHCDLLIMVGTDYPYSEFLPKHGDVIQIDQRALALGRRTATALGVVGSAKPTLKALREQLSARSDRSFWDRVTKERRKWDEMLDKQADPARSEDRVHPQAVARAVSDFAERDAIFILDTGLNTLWSGNWIRQSGSQRILGSFNNAAVGTALGQANGVQALDPTRQVIALCGDGGFNMLMGEFMTAVHHELPIKVVIYDNSAFGLIPLEAEAAGLPRFREGVEFPNPDFAALARACGGPGIQGHEAIRASRRNQRSVGYGGPDDRRRGCRRRRDAQPSAPRPRPPQSFRDGKGQRGRSGGDRRVASGRAPRISLPFQSDGVFQFLNYGICVSLFLNRLQTPVGVEAAQRGSAENGIARLEIRGSRVKRGRGHRRAGPIEADERERAVPPREGLVR